MNEKLWFYVAYQFESGSSWRVIETTLDLDNAVDLVKWIKEEERERGHKIVPVFWKQLAPEEFGDE